jgi:hypothetical protein
MRSAAELDAYEIAYICGGPERVAMVVLVRLVQDGQLTISSDRHRIKAVRRTPRDPVETAALGVVPEVGRVLGLTVLMIAASQAVGQIGRRLRGDRLLPASRVSAWWQWGRVRMARDLRRRLARDPGPAGRERVAVIGAAGIDDDTVRQIFETHVYEPPRSVKPVSLRLGAPLDPLHSTDTPDRSADLYLTAPPSVW